MNTPTVQAKFAHPPDAKLWAQFVAMAPFVFQAARALRNLGILKALDQKEGRTLTELRDVIDLSEYNLSILLDGGESSGLLTKRGERYHLTLAGEYLEKDRLTNINMNFTHDVCYQGLYALEESIRHNRPEGLKVFGAWPTIYEGLTQLPEPAKQSWLDFDHYFSDDAFPKVLPLLFREPHRRILDVGGNTGKFAVACAKYAPEARVGIVDHPAQLRLARARAEGAGVADRIETFALDMLDHAQGLPTGFDAIWMSQFLDCFGKEDILAIMKRTAAIMSTDSHLYIMEPFLDRQKYEASKFCLDMTSFYFTCMANGQSRMYRAADFIELLDQAGLKVVEELGPIRLSHTILHCQLK